MPQSHKSEHEKLEPIRQNSDSCSMKDTDQHDDSSDSNEESCSRALKALRSKRVGREQKAIRRASKKNHVEAARQKKVQKSVRKPKFQIAPDIDDDFSDLLAIYEPCSMNVSEKQTEVRREAEALSEDLNSKVDELSC